MAKDGYKHSSIDKFITEIKNGFHPVNLNEGLNMSDYKFINRFTLEQFDNWDNIPCSCECITCMLYKDNNATGLPCADYVKTIPFEKLLKYGYIRVPVEFNSYNQTKSIDIPKLCEIKANLSAIESATKYINNYVKELLGDDYFHESDYV